MVSERWRETQSKHRVGETSPMVQRPRSHNRYGKAGGKATHSGYDAIGFAAAVPSTPPRSVAIDPCHDRDSIPPFRSRASKYVYGMREHGDVGDVGEREA